MVCDFKNHYILDAEKKLLKYLSYGWIDLDKIWTDIMNGLFHNLSMWLMCPEFSLLDLKLIWLTQFSSDLRHKKCGRCQSKQFLLKCRDHKREI